MHDSLVPLYSNLKKIIGNGEGTRLWEDVWFGNVPLRSKFPRVYALETNKECLVVDRWKDEAIQ